MRFIIIFAVDIGVSLICPSLRTLCYWRHCLCTLNSCCWILLLDGAGCCWMLNVAGCWMLLDIYTKFVLLVFILWLGVI